MVFVNQTQDTTESFPVIPPASPGCGSGQSNEHFINGNDDDDNIDDEVCFQSSLLAMLF